MLRPCSDIINPTRPISRRTRRTHSPSFKAKVALVAVRGDRTLAKAMLFCHAGSTDSDGPVSDCSDASARKSQPKRPNNDPASSDSRPRRSDRPRRKSVSRIATLHKPLKDAAEGLARHICTVCLRANTCCAGSPPLIGNRIPFRIPPKSVQSNQTTSQQSLRQTTGSPRPCVQGTRGGRPGPCGIHPHNHAATCRMRGRPWGNGTHRVGIRGHARGQPARVGIPP